MENLVNSPSQTFWRGKKVLITGHTGFKGSWLCYWLTKMGAKVTGIGLDPITDPALFKLLALDELVDSNITDIVDLEKYRETFDAAQPEVVFHLAAQPIVREGYRRPVSTFATNFMGTVNTLELVRLSKSVQSVVMITTDKVYENKEWIYPYRESDRLGGHDPYSASKAACELAIDSFRKAFFGNPGAPRIASARAGNIIGGGDWSADRLVPDAVRAWDAGLALKIRMPDATRPWQHVLEPLNAYIILAEKIWWSKELAGAYNFGPRSSEVATVREVIHKAKQIYGKGHVSIEALEDGMHEANILALDTSKSFGHLQVKSKWSIDVALTRTMDWYKKLSEGISARELCNSDLTIYGGASD